MIQTAVVKQILPNHVAEVAFVQQAGCGLHCTNCDGCSQAPEQLLALADNPVGAAVGDVVTLRSNRAGTMGAAALVWLLPCVGLIAGYLVADLFGLLQGACILASFVGLAVGFLPAVAVNRAVNRKNVPEFTIVSLGR